MQHTLLVAKLCWQCKQLQKQQSTPELPSNHPDAATFPQPQLWQLPRLVLTERVRWIQKGGRMLLAWSSC